MYEFTLRDGNTLNADEIEQLKNLWMELFEDSKDYLDAFFKVFLPNVELVIGADGSEIISVSYMVPLMTSSNEKCYYLYSGGVKEKMRGKHIFTEANKFIISVTGNAPLFGFTDSKMIEWYKTFLFPLIYSCKELNIVTSSNDKLTKHTLTKTSADIATIKKMREEYLTSLSYDYICYPDWFYYMLKEEKKLSGGVFDIIHIMDRDYYIIGRIEDNTLIIEETNIPSDKVNVLGDELSYSYNVSNIIIKLPLSDSKSDKESSIVYAGQGSTSGNLWAPFALL